MASPQHIAITGARGNPTSLTYYRTTSTNLTRNTQYYDTGTPYKVYDVNGALTTYVYGTAAQGNSTVSCGNSFPTEVDLPISGLITYASWDCNGAVKTSSKDVNGKTTSMSYADPNFWRPTSTVDAAGNSTDVTYTAPSGSTPASVKSKMLFNGNLSVIESVSTMDKFGRLYLSQQREGPSSANYDSGQVNFDSMGRASETTMPFLVQSPNQGTTTAPKTSTFFDAFGRPVQTTDAVAGFVKYTYTKSDVLQEVGPIPNGSGENTKQKQMEYDALGRLVSVCEVTNLAGSGSCGQANPKNGYLTTYTYTGTTTTVNQNTQPNGTTQTRTYVYDLLGRLISETNPENGITTYTFDSASGCTGTFNGDLVKKVDAKGNATCYAYDAIHRVTTVTYTGPDSTNTPAKTFVYDTATVNGVTMTNAKGRLAEAYTGPAASKITDVGFKYSARGEVLEIYQSTPHSGGYYHPTATYWPNGALNTLWISQIPAITYGVDGMGRVATVSATSGQNPVTGTVYDLSTYKTTVSYGSLDSDEFTSDLNTGRMTRYKFNVGSNSLTGDLTWNGNGSLKQLAIADTIPGTSDTQTCSHTHDDLARIATVNCVNGTTTKWVQSFSYDAFGNVKKASSGPGIIFQPSYTGDVGTSTSPTNQFYKIGSGLSGASNYQDANGQVTYDGTHNYTWDVEHKMLTVDAAPSDCSTSGQCLIYDALGRMVEKRVGATYTQIVYGPTGKKFTVMSGQTLQKAWVPLPGGGTAIYTLSGLVYYRHSDHLGSSRLTTTPSRTMYTSTAYAPYGEPYAETTTKDRSFTGQDEDTTTGMYDFLDRKYNPVQGRWLSPDPIGLAAVDPTSPQSWNRYAYVVNDPLALVDPFGDEDCYTRGECWKGVGGAPWWMGGIIFDGFELPPEFAPVVQRAIDSGGAVNCGSLCGPIALPGLGYAFPKFGMDGDITWSFSFSDSMLTNAAVAETLGLPDFYGDNFKIPPLRRLPDESNLLQGGLTLNLKPETVNCNNPDMKPATATATIAVLHDYINEVSLHMEAEFGGNIVTAKNSPLDRWQFSVSFVPGIDTKIVWTYWGRANSPRYKDFRKTQTQIISCQ